MPNTVVFGFKISDLDYNQNFLWATLIGPYWFIEKCVFFVFTLVILFAVAYDLNSLWQSHQRNRYDDDMLHGHTIQSPSPKRSQAMPLQTQSQAAERSNVIPLPDQSKCREQEKPVPPKPKLTAAELREKALGDFIGGGR